MVQKVVRRRLKSSGGEPGVAVPVKYEAGVASVSRRGQETGGNRVTRFVNRGTSGVESALQSEVPAS